MSFLELKNGKVEFTEEGKTLPSVIELYNSDKRIIKKFVDDTATYIFYSYKNGGVYENKLPNARKQMVIDKHLPERTIKDFENNRIVKSIIALFIELEYTPVEQLYLGLKRDIEDLLKRVSNIEYEKNILVEWDSEVDGGETRHFKQWVLMDNSAEKEKAMTLATKLIDFDEKLKAKIYKEKKEKRQTGIALFDNTPD